MHFIACPGIYVPFHIISGCTVAIKGTYPLVRMYLLSVFEVCAVYGILICPIQPPLRVFLCTKNRAKTSPLKRKWVEKGHFEEGSKYCGGIMEAY